MFKCFIWFINYRLEVVQIFMAKEVIGKFVGVSEYDLESWSHPVVVTILKLAIVDS